MIHPGALIVTRTRPHPRCESLGRRKRGSSRPDLGDDLLRRIDAQARHGGQALHGVLMRCEQIRQFLIEVTNLLVEQSQFVERHVQQPPVHRVEVCARAERVTQLFGGRAQPLTRQRDDRGGIRGAIGDGPQHPAGTRAEQNPTRDSTP